MAAVYPTDYPFHTDEEGWPEPVYAPSYPFEHYYDHGRDPHPISEENSSYTYGLVPLTIRRHTPGSADPNSAQLPSRNRSPAISPRLPSRRNTSQPTSHPVPVRRHSLDPTDPDERPIKPMKDTSVYNQSSSRKKPFQSKQPPVQTPKSTQPSPRSESNSFRKSKPIAPSSRFESNSFRTPPPPSRTPVRHNTARRPILIDLIPKTPFGIPSTRGRSHRVIIEEEYEDVQSHPKTILSYRQVTGKSTRELENDQMSQTRRTVRVRSPPVERIIYET